MPKLIIKLSDEQYQHIQEERKYGGRTLLAEECMGGFSLTLNVGVPDIYTHLEMKFINNIDLGEVKWELKK